MSLTNVLLTALLGGIVYIAIRQHQQGKITMSKNEQLSASLAGIQASNAKTSAAITGLSGDVTRLSDKITELTTALEAEKIAPETLALAQQLDTESSAIAESLSALDAQNTEAAQGGGDTAPVDPSNPSDPSEPSDSENDTL